MIYLSGAVRPELMGRTDAGFMLSPFIGNRPDLSNTWFGVDNGCFSQPERFDLAAYLAWLEERRPYRERCLFAVAPDVPGNAAATLDRSLPVLRQIRELGFPAALAAQNGLERLTVPWSEFDVLFIGGLKMANGKEWKLSEAAYSLVAEAKQRGLKTHQGRCNSLRRLRAAAMAGYDSADGTFLAFGPDANLPRLERWLRELREQPSMLLEASL